MGGGGRRPTIVGNFEASQSSSPPSPNYFIAGIGCAPSPVYHRMGDVSESLRLSSVPNSSVGWYSLVATTTKRERIAVWNGGMLGRRKDVGSAADS